MATTRRDTPLSLGLGLGKDKMPVKSLSRSSSAAPASGPSIKKSLKQSTSIATIDHKAHPLNNKNLTNYHKPALVSRTESTSASTSTPTRFLRKPTSISVPDQKSLNRRRSFDKPLNSTSRVQHHALVSPCPKERTITNKTRSPAPITKTSTSVAPNSSQRPRTIRRSTTSPSPAIASRKAVATNRRSSPLKKVITRPAEAELEDDCPIMLGADDEIEEIASIGSDADLVPFDHIEKTDFMYNVGVNSTDKEIEKAYEEEIIKAEEEDKNCEAIVKEIMVDSHEDEKKVEEKADEEGKEEEKEDGKLAPVAAPAPEIGKQRQSSAGKKDSPVYNDVIKETASKLLEKRKNKVSALVGAFETVISLQE